MAHAVVHASTTGHHKPVAMGSYSASAYSKAAAKLPAGLTAALKRIHLTPAQYLANAAADAQAPTVVASLKSLGVHVLASKMSGSKLTVNVASASDVAKVKAAGATAVVGAAAQHAYAGPAFHKVDSTDSYGGEGYFFFAKKGAKSGSGYRCSVGFNGYNVSTGSSQFVTAGHCATIIPSGNSVYTTPTNEAFIYTENNGNGLSLGAPLGTAVGEGEYGSGMDYGIVSSHDTGVVSHPSIAQWGGGTSDSVSAPNVPPVGTTSNPTASAGTNSPLPITGEIAATVGDALCKSGSTSGWTCGTVLAVDQYVDVSDKHVNSIVASTCLLEGDSGGGAVDGNYAMGIDSGSTWDPSDSTAPADDCDDPATEIDPNTGYANGNDAVFFPMVSAAGKESVQGQQGSHWQLAVTVSTGAPTLTAPASTATLYPFQSLSGTLSGFTAGSSDVLLYLDGSTTPFTKVAVSSTGTWSIPLTNVSQGTHSYTLASGVGYSAGGSVIGTLTMSEAPRLDGTDSYDTATLISQQLFPGTSPTVHVLYIAGNSSYANALTAAPAVARQGGALLLTEASSLPSEVATEITRLHPQNVVVVGSTSSVTSTVYNKIETLLSGAQTISRIYGGSSTSTSLEVNSPIFTTTGGTVFIASSTSYASIQSEVSAAGKTGSPVILVTGSSSTVPAATLTYLKGLEPTKVILSGTSSTISTALKDQLITALPSATVTRIDGSNWYQTSQLIDSQFFTSSAKAYLVSESSSSNNLASGVLAGETGSPVLLSESTCVKSYQLTALQSWGVTQPTVIGSSSSLSSSVRLFKSC